MSLFYVGLNPRFNWWKWLPKGINVMYSAAGFYNGHLKWRRKGWIPGAGSRWLDSGGFTLIKKHGDYPFGYIGYLNLVARLKPDFYATMDYPCIPQVAQYDAWEDNRERIDRTVYNAFITLDADVMVGHGAVPVPVIQGFTLDEYKYCIDRLHKIDCIRPYMAVGSMVRQLSNEQIDELIPGIYDYAIQAGAERLHWFGLKVDKRLMSVSHAIYSRDSAAILDDYVHGEQIEERWPRTQEARKQRVLENLALLESQGLQTTNEA